jgi:hypothetical protein
MVRDRTWENWTMVKRSMGYWGFYGAWSKFIMLFNQQTVSVQVSELISWVASKLGP